MRYPSRRYKAKKTVILLIDYKLPETRSAIACDDRPIISGWDPDSLAAISETHFACFRTYEHGERELISADSAAPKWPDNNYVDYSIKIDVDKIALRGNGLFMAADAPSRYRGLFISSSSRLYRDIVKSFAKIISTK